MFRNVPIPAAMDDIHDAGLECDGDISCVVFVYGCQDSVVQSSQPQVQVPV